MMTEIHDFLTTDQDTKIVEAIRQAELNTSGEIRVHIESLVTDDHLAHAANVFHKLKMNQTAARNGVLIYVAVKSRVFVIYGDKGINEVVPDNFWESTKDIMQRHFRKNDFTTGLVEGIQKAGEQLKKYFPRASNDINELPDNISKS